MLLFGEYQSHNNNTNVNEQMHWTCGAESRQSNNFKDPPCKTIQFWAVLSACCGVLLSWEDDLIPTVFNKERNKEGKEVWLFIIPTCCFLWIKKHAVSLFPLELSFIHSLRRRHHVNLWMFLFMFLLQFSFLPSKCKDSSCAHQSALNLDHTQNILQCELQRWLLASS